MLIKEVGYGHLFTQNTKLIWITRWDDSHLPNWKISFALLVLICVEVGITPDAGVIHWMTGLQENQRSLQRCSNVEFAHRKSPLNVWVWNKKKLKKKPSSHNYTKLYLKQVEAQLQLSPTAFQICLQSLCIELSNCSTYLIGLFKPKNNIWNQRENLIFKQNLWKTKTKPKIM